MWTIASLLLLGSTLSAADPAPPEPLRAELKNGVRLVAVQVAEAERQSTFTFLPLHLGNDGAQRPQWSHLLEHHLIRSTDPDGLGDEAMMINGETGGNSMRLESIVIPEKAAGSFERHGKWLAARDFAPEVHGREISAIAGEERGTSMGGHTHKFALAAWNQVVRHGQTHAPVHQSIADSTAEAAAAYAKARLPIDERTLVVTIGPMPAAEAMERLKEHCGGLERRSPPLPPATRAGDVDEWPRRLEATWDLPVLHVMLWRRVPADDLRARAAAMVSAYAMMSQLVQAGGVQQSGVVFDNITTPEGRYFVASVSLRPGADVEAAAARLEGWFDGLAVSAAMMCTMMAGQFGSPDMLEQMRRQMPGHARPMVEAQWMLTRTNMEYSAGAPIEEVVEVWRGLGVTDLETFLRVLREGSGGILVLRPREE